VSVAVAVAVVVSVGAGVGVSDGVSVTVAVCVTVSVGVTAGVLVTVDVCVDVAVAVGPGQVPSHGPAPVSAWRQTVCPATHMPATPPEQSTAASQHARTVACESAQAMLQFGKHGPGMLARQNGARVPEYDSQTQHMAWARGAAESMTIAAITTAAGTPRCGRRLQSRYDALSSTRLILIRPNSSATLAPERVAMTGDRTRHAAALSRPLVAVNCRSLQRYVDEQVARSSGTKPLANYNRRFEVFKIEMPKLCDPSRRAVAVTARSSPERGVVSQFDRRMPVPPKITTAKDAKGAKQRCLAPLASLAVPSGSPGAST
jgi:hypothetical protein